MPSIPWHTTLPLCRDGTTSTVLFIGELMRQAERYLNEGLHPRVIVEVGPLAPTPVACPAQRSPHQIVILRDLRQFWGCLLRLG